MRFQIDSRWILLSEIIHIAKMQLKIYDINKLLSPRSENCLNEMSRYLWKQTSYHFSLETKIGQKVWSSLENGFLKNIVS